MVLAVTILGVSSLTSATPAFAAAEEVSGFAFGTVHPSFNAPGTPLLDHFYFRYTNSDHHLRHISAYPETGGTTQIAFHDIDWDDEYFYRVAHQRVSSTGIVRGSFGDVCVAQCTREIPRPAGNYVFVLTGFWLSFNGNDHHLDTIGIIESGGLVTTWYSDKNNDDTYMFNFSYAWVPTSRFSTVAEISETVYFVGTRRRDVPTGAKVIRGFYFDNIQSNDRGDNHVKELGVMTNSSSIDLYYMDKEFTDDPPWKYRVKYAILT